MVNTQGRENKTTTYSNRVRVDPTGTCVGLRMGGYLTWIIHLTLWVTSMPHRLAKATHVLQVLWRRCGKCCNQEMLKAGIPMESGGRIVSRLLERTDLVLLRPLWAENRKLWEERPFSLEQKHTYARTELAELPNACCRLSSAKLGPVGTSVIPPVCCCE